MVCSVFPAVFVAVFIIWPAKLSQTTTKTLLKSTTNHWTTKSKTVSYSYPASEHGGSGSKTVYFQETVPVNINIHVDTTPFDQSVAIANATVDTLTGAVVSMNSSQCSAIHESGEKISNALTEGFYKLIGSELTTQISENKSVLQSKIALVIELSKDIANKLNTVGHLTNLTRTEIGKYTLIVEIEDNAGNKETK